MASSSNPQPLLQPLNVGNVVSAGLRLYREHFGQYFRIAGLATLWSLLPFLVLIPLLAIAALVFGVQSNYGGLILLLVPAWIVLLLFCTAKFYARSASIYRLAFGELVQQPEAESSALRFCQSRMWGFLGVNLLLGLLFAAVFMVCYIVAAIVFGIAFFVLGGPALLQAASPEEIAQLFLNSPNAILGIALVALVLIGAVITFLIWLFTRFAIAELPLAIEAETTMTNSIGRSWSLTRKQAWRMALVLILAAAITLPIYLLNWVLGTILDGILAGLLSSESSTYAVLSFVTTYSLGLVLNVLVLPLWQSIKAVLYYDLRSRREGLGLQLRDRAA